MKVNAYRILCYSCFISLFVFCLSAYSVQPPPLSTLRIQKISKVISKYKESGENLEDNDVVNTILKDVSELKEIGLSNIEPEAKKNIQTIQEIGKVVREKVAQKFPESSEDLKTKAEAEAEKIFVMAKILDQVSVKYLKGDNPYVANGCFYSYGSTGHSILVGETVIAVYDIAPEDRIRFDKDFRDQKKASYVETKIRSYYSEKNAYSVQVYNEVKDAVIKENEDNGYIFFMNDWRSPKEVTLRLIKETLNSPNTATPKTAVASAATTPAEDPNSPTSLSKTDAAAQKKKEDIKAIAEEKQRNTSKNAGIDADQGFELAYWGIKKEDFALLYPQYANANDPSEIVVINYDKGPRERMELHFTSDLLYKVVCVFRIGPPEAMSTLGKKIKEKYGAPDQEKMDAPAVPEKEKANRKEQCLEDSHQFVNGICKKCGWSEAELNTTPVEIYTWTGKETYGTLTIRLNTEKTDYTEFILTRENPRIRDLAVSNAEQQKKKELEEQKKKVIEEYKSYK